MEETKQEIEKSGTIFVRAKEATDVIRDFEEMLYGSDEVPDEPGLAEQIQDLVDEKIQIAKDLGDCMDSMAVPDTDKRQLNVRMNRLENTLFDLNDRIEQVFEGVEENFVGI